MLNRLERNDLLCLWRYFPIFWWCHIVLHSLMRDATEEEFTELFLEAKIPEKINLTTMEHLNSISPRPSWRLKSGINTSYPDDIHISVDFSRLFAFLSGNVRRLAFRVLRQLYSNSEGKPQFCEAKLILNTASSVSDILAPKDDSRKFRDGRKSCIQSLAHFQASLVKPWQRQEPKLAGIKIKQ